MILAGKAGIFEKKNNMNISRTDLLADLQQRTESVRSAAERLRSLPVETLNWRPEAGQWSILECLEHLNLYGDFYLVEIEKRMLQAPARPEARRFRSGWLGNYFAKMMAPKEGEVKNKMKTFKDKNPLGSELDPTIVDRFLRQQERMVGLLEMAQQHDLSRVKTGITISKWIKLRLGDTFRVVIYHNERHLVQAQAVLAAAPELALV